MQAEAVPRTMRQQRADETKRRIFAAATELFATHGYHATTVDRIAAHAGVAKGTFFIHFPAKDKVILDLVRIQVGAARKARARALATGGPIEALRAAVLTLGQHAAASRTLSRGVLAATLESPEVGGLSTEIFDELHAEMLADARSAARAGMLHRGADPDALAGALMASYLGATLHFTTSTRAKPLVEILAPLVETNLAGVLRPQPTRKPPARSTRRRTR